MYPYKIIRVRRRVCAGVCLYVHREERSDCRVSCGGRGPRHSRDICQLIWTAEMGREAGANLEERFGGGSLQDLTRVAVVAVTLIFDFKSSWRHGAQTLFKAAHFLAHLRQNSEEMSLGPHTCAGTAHPTHRSVT